jgi:hypothetical protein
LVLATATERNINIFALGVNQNQKPLTQNRKTRKLYRESRQKSQIVPTLSVNRGELPIKPTTANQPPTSTVGVANPKGNNHTTSTRGYISTGLEG